MKALVWTNPREFKLQEIPMPEAQKGEVVLKTRYAGICGSDLSGYLGENSLRKPPLIMGHEFTGEVVETGEGVTEFKPGNLVVVNPLITCGCCRMCKQGDQQNCIHRSIIGIHHPGAFAEYVKVPASSCFFVDDEVAGTLVEPLACGIRAAERAGVSLEDNVVVFGAGIIGLFSLKAASLQGAGERILIDTNDERLEQGKLFGATHTLNPKHVNAIEKVKEITGGSLQKVIDAVGLPLTRQQGIEMVENGGRIVFIGLHEDDTVVPGNVIVRKEIEIAGSFSYSDRNFAHGLSLIQRKEVVPDKSWLDIRPLEQGKQSFEEQIFGPAQYPKIVLSV